MTREWKIVKDESLSFSSLVVLILSCVVRLKMWFELVFIKFWKVEIRLAYYNFLSESAFLQSEIFAISKMVC